MHWWKLATSRRVGLAALAAGAIGCSSPPAMMACTPGATMSCVCTDGRAGAQSCNAEGTGFDACACAEIDAAVPSIDAVVDVDAFVPRDAFVQVDAGGPMPDAFVSDAYSADVGHDAGAIAVDGGVDGGRDGGVDAGGDGGMDAGPLGPCGAVPATGRCASATVVEYCGTPTGEGDPEVVSVACLAGDVCDATGEFAICRSTAICRDGELQCLDATTVRLCTGGSWVSSTCPRSCVSTAIGDGCAPDTATRTLTGRFVYQARGPNAAVAPTGWGGIVTIGAQGFLVVSIRGSAIVDAVVTTTASDGSGGRFSIRVPTVAAPGDLVAAFAVGVAFDGSLAYVVADPGYAPSATPQGILATAGSRPAPRLWAWSFALTSIVDGDTLTIPESGGSGAARVFDYLRYVYGVTDAFFLPPAPESVVVWLGMGTRWDCGACFLGPAGTTEFGLAFRHQAFLPGAPGDAEYWSDAVTAHEFGHYTMAAYGHVVGEGGGHGVGVPTNPGQAWSEGWATFFSSDVRASSIYYDQQAGTFFWWDLNARTYSRWTWQRPTPAGGLFQLMDENEVSAMLWSIEGSVGRDGMWRALADPRMTVSPFERGYGRRIWPAPLGMPAHPELWTEIGPSTTMVADYFDALLCADLTRRSAIDTAAQPSTHYPYPSGSPLCR